MQTQTHTARARAAADAATARARAAADGPYAQHTRECGIAARLSARLCARAEEAGRIEAAQGHADVAEEYARAAQGE